MAKKTLNQPQLRPEVAEKYTATITPCVIEIQRLGRTVDLTQLTLEQANELVQDPKFIYLVPKKAKRKRAAPAVNK
ncbi:hypothetical protein CDA63_11785 [Hymenobacter amundsenii]|uniref:Uncharacterized protein n=1 Tax=Hymenobacter amundsenii TaxID=2006685 RepID=A0A246FK08_9BACT|nr:hypothetical protein [Hymenobacter amundsenii]OWP62892.1 hypothetical protein CDA63_11785 [Hymenobacter amundsenii]